MIYGLCEVDYITFVPIVVVSDILVSRTDKCYSFSRQNTTLVEITYTGWPKTNVPNFESLFLRTDFR